MLKPTKHATTNFKMLVPFLDAVDRCEGSITMTRGGLMPLSIEDLGYTFEGRKVYGMMHFYTQAGDMMRDPDMTFAVDLPAGQHGTVPGGLLRGRKAIQAKAPHRFGQLPVAVDEEHLGAGL